MKLFEYNCFKPTPFVLPKRKDVSSFIWCPVFGKKPQPCQRSRHAITVCGNEIYMYGGRSAKGTVAEFWVYNSENTTWTELFPSGDLPPPLEGHTMELYDDSIYMFGGETSFATADESPLWQLDLVKNKWTKFQHSDNVLAPSGRRHHTSVLYKDMMCIYGGYQDLIGPSKDMWLFDFETQSWHYDVRASSSCAPDARYGHCSAVDGNSMWVCGGLTGLKPNSDVNVWNFELKVWISVKTKGGPTELSDHAMSLVNHSLYVFGGRTSSSEDSSNDMWCMSLSDKTWRKLYFNDDIKPSSLSGHCLTALSVPSTFESRGLRMCSLPDVKKNKHTSGTIYPEISRSHSISYGSLPDITQTKVIEAPENQTSDRLKLLDNHTSTKNDYMYDNPVYDNPDKPMNIQNGNSHMSIPTINRDVENTTVTLSPISNETTFSSDMYLMPGSVVDSSTTERLGHRNSNIHSFSYNIINDSMDKKNPNHSETSFIQIPSCTSGSHSNVHTFKKKEYCEPSGLTRIQIKPRPTGNIELLIGDTTQKKVSPNKDFQCENEEQERESRLPAKRNETNEGNSKLLIVLGGRATDVSPLCGKPFCMWQCIELV